MLGITKRTDYALLALTHLAAAGQSGSVSAREIAERYGIPPDLLAKILQRLAKSGLVVSSPGRSGGYALAKPAAEITIGSVLQAVEGTPALTQCQREEPGDCEQILRCTIRRPLERIGLQMLAMLDGIPLSEIAGPAPAQHANGHSEVVRTIGKRE